MLRWPTYLLLILFQSTSFYSDGQVKKHFLEPILDERGNSIGETYEFVEDPYGYIWIASKTGVYRYDGHRLRSINHVFRGARGPLVTSLAMHGDRLFILSYHEGLISYHVLTGSIDYHSLVNETINDQEFCKIKLLNGDLWITTTTSVFRIDLTEQSVTLIHDLGEKGTLGFIEFDESDNVWISYWNKLLHVNASDNTVTIHRPAEIMSDSGDYLAFHHSEGDTLFLSGSKGSYKALLHNHEIKLIETIVTTPSIVTCQIRGAGDQYNVGTLGHGMFMQTNKQTENITAGNDENSLSTNLILSLHYLNNGILLIGTFNGLYKLVPGKQLFHTSRPSERLAEFSSSITGLKCVSDTSIWVNCLGGGILNVNSNLVPVTTSNTEYFKDDKLSTIQYRNVNWMSFEDGILYITLASGLFAFDVTSSTLSEVWRTTSNLQLVHSIGPYLLIVTKFTGVFLVEKKHPEKVVKTYFSTGRGTYDFTEDIHSNLFMLEDGIRWFDPHALEWVQLVPPELITQQPTDVHLAGDTVWFLADQLYVYTLADSKLRSFSFPDGNTVHDALVPDKKGNIWISSLQGIYRFVRKEQRFEKYTKTDGVRQTRFEYACKERLPDGTILFGGTDGIVKLNPDHFTHEPVAWNLKLVDVKYHGTTLQKAYPDISFISDSAFEFDYYHNSLQYEFSDFSFTSNSNYQYAYRILPIDDDWRYTIDPVTGIYSNLSPGNYRLELAQSDLSGKILSEAKVITITILPPPWKTWWAYSLYGLGFVLILVAARNEIVKRERLKNRMKIKELEAGKLHELDTMKSRFFANISHEFRTPLTLILGPIEKQAAKATNTEDKTELQLVKRNASRLLNLVNQLLDLSRIEAGSMKLHCKPGNLTEFVLATASQFQSMAASKEIRFELDTPEEVICFFDPDKLDKVLFNLLSNAFKFTPKYGNIRLSLKQFIGGDSFAHDYAEMQVADTGPGIAPEHLDKIFDRFFQVDASFTREHEGSGLGLALVKELVELHHGTIKVESHPGEGAKFIVRLPMGGSHLTADEIDITMSVQDLTKKELVVQQKQDETTFDAPHAEPSHPRILIVEDNDDLRYYIRESLKKDYTLLLARNGKEGIELALEEIPDLVVSDLMMPLLDGFQLCGQLKTDERTSHIPIILLTAKADQSAKMEGYETGADDYIAKPFDMPELQVRIRNLIESRKRLIEKFSGQIALKPSQIKVESVDDRFIKKVLETIEAHLGDSSFGVEVLSGEVAMSSAQLYRKVKALTNFKPVDLIRHIRLERAADLLKQSAGNVSEVAYRVGFNNLSYFAKVFKDKYGVNPSEFVKH